MSSVLVMIHGIGKQMSDFYREPLQALTALLGLEPPCLPCWYADLSNMGAPVFDATDGPLTEEQEFHAQLRKEIRLQRAEIEAQAPSSEIEFGVINSALMLADLTADVTRYLFQSDYQEAAQQRLRSALEQAAKTHDHTVLVSHSLGTVVAYDVLRTHAASYNISQFFTLGSPLRKVVRLRRTTANIGAITATTVPRWRNIYDTTDPVANPLGPTFPSYPIEDQFIDIAEGAVASHDYWGNAQVREIIAQALRM